MNLCHRNRRLNLESLESRIVLDGGGLGPPAFIPPDGPPFEPPPEGHADFDTPPIANFVPGEPPVAAPPSQGDATSQQAVGANWIEFDFRRHKKHTDHVTWDTDPSTDAMVTVTVLVHDHGNNLSTDKTDRLNDAIAEVNSAATNFGALLNLQTVTDETAAHQIHLHEDSTSGCGGSALGCAEFAIFIDHAGEFGDGDGNHLYAGEDTSGGRAEATLLSGFNWYTGADAGAIGGSQYDYQTVATQELLHLVGLDHDSTVYDEDSETVGNTNRQSVMHGTLAQGDVRRFMSTHDQETLVHLYGTGQTAPPPDDGGGGGGKGRPKGKGKTSVVEASATLAQTQTTIAIASAKYDVSSGALGTSDNDDHTDAPLVFESDEVGPAWAVVNDEMLDILGRSVARQRSTNDTLDTNSSLSVELEELKILLALEDLYGLPQEEI